jgi:hypothetical protein
MLPYEKQLKWSSEEDMELPMIYKISPRPSFPKRGGKNPYDYAKTHKIFFERGLK